MSDEILNEIIVTSCVLIKTANLVDETICCFHGSFPKSEGNFNIHEIVHIAPNNLLFGPTAYWDCRDAESVMGTVKKKLKIGGASDNHTIQNRLFREE